MSNMARFLKIFTSLSFITLVVLINYNYYIKSSVIDAAEVDEITYSIKSSIRNDSPSYSSGTVTAKRVLENDYDHTTSSDKKYEARKKVYVDYLNNNYLETGFYTRSASLNSLLALKIFDNVSDNKYLQSNDTDKNIDSFLRFSKVSVYMLELKTLPYNVRSDIKTEYVTITKEQYEKVQVGDNVVIKNGELEIKN